MKSSDKFVGQTEHLPLKNMHDTTAASSTCNTNDYSRQRKQNSKQVEQDQNSTEIKRRTQRKKKKKKKRRRKKQLLKYTTSLQHCILSTTHN
jgi:hypothetical protein